MKKLDERPPAFDLFPASNPDLRPARRLIVLAPESEEDPAFAARKIRELANTLESRVQFLGLSKDAAHEPALRRQLVTLSAMVGGGNISVESKIENGRHWLDAVQSEWREGDVIVCLTEQRSGLARRPLSQILESKLNATVYVLTDIREWKERPRSGWMPNALAWAGSLGIILFFLWLQIKLSQPPMEWASSVLFYISLFAEAGSIWAWNSLIG